MAKRGRQKRAINFSGNFLNEAELARTISAKDIDPRLVHPAMASFLAVRYGYELSIKEKGEGKVVFALTVT